jgi:hypothetical protein
MIPPFKLLSLLLFVLPLGLFAQNSSIKGFVYDGETGEPSIFTNVYLKGTTIGASTDINGYFNLNKLKEGEYTLVVSFIGYDTLEVQIALGKNQIVSQKLTIKKSAIQLKDITVSGDKQDQKINVQTSIVKITPKQINQIPTIGGQPDLAQYLQLLPGVIFTGDQGGQLYIRGGAPIQNKVMLDGMVIYNPFHSIGLFSVFDSDIIRNADVYTGGFNAEYGGRISSVMDITMRDGNKNRFAGKVSASTFGSKLLLEGPLKKYSESAQGSSSFIFSIKNSYLEQSSKALYRYVDTAGLPFNFTDLYAKLSLNSKNGSKANFFGFKFMDDVKYQALSNLNWNAWGAGSSIVLVPSGSPVLIKSNISYSKYEITLEELDSKPRNSMINNYNFGLGFNYLYGKNSLEYGLDVEGGKTNFNFVNAVGRYMDQIQNTTDLAAYIKYKYVFGKFLMEPGFRMQYYSSLSTISPEPRLGLKYNVTEQFRLKLAGGWYSQNLIAANSDRDVVNLFYGFLASPETGDLQAEFKGKEIKNSLQRARHLIVGFEYDLPKHFELNVEGYLKQNTQLTNINRNKLYDDIPENSDQPDYLKKDFVIETGDAYGVDFLIKYDYKRVYLWAAYSLGYVDRSDEYTDYHPHYDRRHNINLVSSYTMGKNFNWEISGRWNLGSGFPFTKTQGFFEQLSFTDGIGSNYTSTNGQLGIIYGDLNQGRLPYYHRLDLTLKRMWEIGRNGKVEATLSITNVYNRQNIFYYDRIKHERVDQLPFMPSVGLNVAF